MITGTHMFFVFIMARPKKMPRPMQVVCWVSTLCSQVSGL